MVRVGFSLVKLQENFIQFLQFSGQKENSGNPVLLNLPQNTMPFEYVKFTTPIRNRLIILQSDSTKEPKIFQSS